jgi:hypothetical protein
MTQAYKTLEEVANDRYASLSKDGIQTAMLKGYFTLDDAAFYMQILTNDRPTTEEIARRGRLNRKLISLWMEKTSKDSND